ncbi:MAG: hypothetical protein AAF585_24310 [Verrucomicrobiota bacterium]
MKQRERNLLFIFAGLLVLVSVLIFWDAFSVQRSKISQEIDILSMQLVEFEALVEDRDYWLARGDWLRSRQPQFPTNELAYEQLYQLATAGAPTGVQVNVKLTEPVTTLHYYQAGVAVTAVGELEPIFTWFYDLQQPELFRVIRNLTVIPDKKDSRQVRCTFELLRWYSPPNNETTE